MATTKKLKVELSATDKISRVTKGVGRSIANATKGWKDFGSKGSAAIEAVTRKLFFMKEAVGVVTGLLGKLWSTFITPAINARKMAQSLTNVFGAGTADRIRTFSKETGLAFGTISKGVLDMEGKLGRAGGMEGYLKAIERVSKWRPDLGAEGAMSFVNDIINKVGEATEGSSKQLGQYTSVVAGGTKAQAIDLTKELDKLGVVAKVVDPTVTAFDRLREAWDDFAARVGGKVLDKLAEAGIKMLDWLTENEDKVYALTDAFTDFINEGLQKLIDWMSGEGPDKMIESFKEFLKVIQDIWTAIQPVVAAVGKFGGGVFDSDRNVANPWEGGGGGVKAAGRAVGAAVFTPKKALDQVEQTMKLLPAIIAGGIGRLVGGRETGARWATKVASIPTGAERQRAAQDVHVVVDDEGSLRAYTQNEIGANNATMAAWAGG